MGIPGLQLVRDRRLRKPILALLFAAIATGVAVSLAFTQAVKDLNEPFYDAAYRLRRPVARDAVIVTANQASLDSMASGENHWGWPWPRQFWGLAITYVEKCGARAAAVDLLFSEPSVHNAELPDDKTFAGMLDEVKMPVVFATVASPKGTPSRFAPPVKRAVIVGAVNFPKGSTIRDYLATVSGVPSLAVQTVRFVGGVVPQWAAGEFRLHYYGKHQYPGGRTTFQYVSAANVFEAAQDPEHPEKHGVDPAVFKDKIVLFGTTAAGTFDLKASPVDEIYPGVEIHATAIENLLSFQRVSVVGTGGVAGMTAAAAVAASVGALGARRTSRKLVASGLVLVALFALVVILFRLAHIVWLPPVAPLLGTVISVVLALSWSYFAEDRQSRFFLRALGQYVSPRVAAELKADPSRLSLSTEERELTILFSDIAGFTDITERLKRRVGALLNFYLAEMSEPVHAQDGTLDKYIGDAIMAFWNAPLAQSDHAVRACRAALAMQRREAQITPALVELGGEGMFTRIGINTGDCAFGNLGSPEKFNYTCIGDACNFASRLEGANKLYGSRILLGETTARIVRNQFVMRKLDVLRVKGKLEPQAVYELIAEGAAEEATVALIEKYEAALGHYCRGAWDEAEKILLDVLTRVPQDGPSRQLLSRIAGFRDDPPPVGWDGVYVSKTK